jgi:kynurenine 3-monooxygenase
MTLFMAHKGNPSFSALDSREKVKDFFEEHFADALPLMPDWLDDYHRNPTSSLVMVKCAPWNVSDRVMLMGDACHAIVPFYGQGMNAGFEDCRLFDEMTDQCTSEADLFEKFSSERKPQTDGILELALRNYIEMRDLTADPRFILQKKIEARLAERHPNRWTPLYSLVTFSHTPYDQALNLGIRQDEFMKTVLDNPESAELWENDEFIDRIAQTLPD